MDMRNDLTSTPRRMWLWAVAILVSLPIGGYIADRAVNGVDSVGAALAGGLIVGAVIARHRIRGALWWAVVNLPAWALGWVVSSYVISRNIGERISIFGASGALVFGLLTWLLLAALFRVAPADRRTAASAVA